MSAKNLSLQVVLAAKETVLGPLKAITRGSGETAKALKAAKDQLKELTDAQKRVDIWRKTDKDLAIMRNGLKGAQERIKHLKDEIAKVPAPTRDMSRSLKEATEEARTLKSRVAVLAEKKERLRHELSAAGVDTKNLVAYQRELKPKLDAATASVKQQTDAMQKQNAVAHKMYAARAEYDKVMAARNTVLGGGTSLMAAGATIGLPVIKVAKDYATFEDAMLGVARQVEGARDANGRLTATYYEMGDAIKAMAERIPMATTEIAKIVEAGARMGIQGKENLLIYAETAAVMAHAFDLPVEQVGENMARIADLFRIPINRVGELGDAINWLDDNSTAKGGDIIEVMQRIAGVATAAGMNFREAAALGSTFLSMGANAQVAATATQAMIRELSVATMQSKRFRVGAAMLNLDLAQLQKSASTDPTGTILRVLEAIKKLPKEKQLEATTRLFGKEYGDDAAKLAQNIDMYRKHLQLANDEAARGSMQREADARKGNISAMVQIAKSAMFNLSADLGEHLRPVLADTFGAILDTVKAMRAWAKEHPELSGFLLKTIGIIAVVLTVLGALGIALAGILGPLAVARFGFSLLSIHGQWLWHVIKGVGWVIGYAAGKFAWLAKLVLTNPIALAITAIAVAAFLIWKYWDPIKKFFSDLWDSVSLTFKLTWEGIKTWFASLPGDLMATGRAIMEGLANGIKSGWQWVKDALGGLAKLMPGYVEKPLDIHSPSRVFARIGAHTMEGLQEGIELSGGGPLSAVMKTARQLAAAGAGVMIGGAAMAGDLPRIDTRAALSTAAATMGAGAPMIVNITINAAPGMNETALARQVAAELQRIEANRAARGRSRLRDSE